jgi:hypothetical protein
MAKVTQGIGTVLEVGAGLLLALAVVGLMQTGTGDYGLQAFLLLVTIGVVVGGAGWGLKRLG